MAGKVIVHGVETFIMGGVNLYIDETKVGNVKMNETLEIPLEKDGVLYIRNGLNTGEKLNVYTDGITEVQCKWNRLTGKFKFDIIQQTQKATEIKAQKEAAYNKEHRMRCNVCGNIFCYTQKEWDENVTKAVGAGLAGLGLVASALGGSSLDIHMSRANADSASSKVKDYTKCPKCNSSDLTDIADEAGAQEAPAIGTENSKVSAMEELKQLKELLDMGILTQEEFDAKKKQLLGL